MPFTWIWLYGPSGVGKSSVGFELYSRLVADGRPVAFVELDQIGMCMPAPPEARAAAKADNLLAVLDHARAAGTERVVVSGDIAGAAMDDVLQRSPTRPFLCRLRAEHHVVVERLTTRGSPGFAAASRTYDHDHVVPEGDHTLVTDRRTISELADELLDALGPWASTAAAPPASGLEPPAPCDLPGMLLTGPRAVGKSTVAWQLHLAWGRGGVCSGYLDLEQLGFVRAPAAVTAAVRAANAVACADGLRRHGARRLVLCGAVGGPADLATHRRLFPNVDVVTLTARPATVLERARRRAAHKEIWLPGDDLFGRADAQLQDLAQGATDVTGDGGDLVVETDGLDVDEVVARVTAWRVGRDRAATT